MKKENFNNSVFQMTGLDIRSFAVAGFSHIIIISIIIIIIISSGTT